jgi:hypothetical protein
MSVKRHGSSHERYPCTSTFSLQIYEIVASSKLEVPVETALHCTA